MNRKQEQSELLFKLGALLGPLVAMADNPASYDADEQNRILARFFSERPKFSRAFQEFTVAEPGHDYSIHFYKVNNALQAIGNYQISSRQIDDQKFYELIRDTTSLVRDLIVAIPVPVDSAIYEARTSFSTYCLVKDLCSTVRERIVWLDRYFDHNIFHRFFSNTSETAVITLVTLPHSTSTGKADQSRVAAFMDLSRLFAQQRGTVGYRLIENSNFHDRWLQCDDKLFALGGSIKDLTKSGTFTITRLDSTRENVQHFDAAVSGGNEVFGPQTPTHP